MILIIDCGDRFATEICKKKLSGFTLMELLIPSQQLYVEETRSVAPLEGLELLPFTVPREGLRRDCPWWIEERSGDSVIYQNYQHLFDAYRQECISRERGCWSKLRSSNIGSRMICNRKWLCPRCWVRHYTAQVFSKLRNQLFGSPVGSTQKGKKVYANLAMKNRPLLMTAERIRGHWQPYSYFEVLEAARKAFALTTTVLGAVADGWTGVFVPRAVPDGWVLQERLILLVNPRYNLDTLDHTILESYFTRNYTGRMSYWRLLRIVADFMIFPLASKLEHNQQYLSTLTPIEGRAYVKGYTNFGGNLRKQRRLVSTENSVDANSTTSASEEAEYSDNQTGDADA